MRARRRQSASRTTLVAERQRAAERLADLKVQEAKSIHGAPVQPTAFNTHSVPF
jgi:hypothetical protein